MKMLLTSAGPMNKSISDVVRKWIKGPIKIAFIPTASNVSDENKDWLIKDYVNCLKIGSVDIVDISALDKKMWLPRLKKANVIVVGGGNTAYLMKCIVSSGLQKELPKLIKERVYVGISAGSIVTAKTLNASSEFLYGDELKKEISGLGYVNFNIRPHLNSKDFPNAKDSVLKKVTKKLKGDTYALDDQSAVAYENGKITVVSEGKWILYKN